MIIVNLKWKKKSLCGLVTVKLIIHSINIQSERDGMSRVRGVQKCSDAGPTVTIQQPKSSLWELFAVFILKKQKKNTLLEQNLHNCSTYRPVAGKSERSAAQPQNSCQGNKGEGSTGACQRPWKITVEGGAVAAVVVVNAAAGGEPFSHVSKEYWWGRVEK